MIQIWETPRFITTYIWSRGSLSHTSPAAAELSGAETLCAALNKYLVRAEPHERPPKRQLPDLRHDHTVIINILRSENTWLEKRIIIHLKNFIFLHFYMKWHELLTGFYKSFFLPFFFSFHRAARVKKRRGRKNFKEKVTGRFLNTKKGAKVK